MGGTLRKLAPHHVDAMVQRLTGASYREIGDKLGRSERTVRHWFLDEPVFVAAWEAERAGAREQALTILQGAAPAAARHVVASQDARSEMVGLLAAKDILDRIGLKPVDRHATTNVAGEDAPVTVEHSHTLDLTVLNVEELTTLVQLLERAERAAAERQDGAGAEGPDRLR